MSALLKRGGGLFREDTVLLSMHGDNPLPNILKMCSSCMAELAKLVLVTSPAAFYFFVVIMMKFMMKSMMKPVV